MNNIFEKVVYSCWHMIQIRVFFQFCEFENLAIFFKKIAKLVLFTFFYKFKISPITCLKNDKFFL
jgi:hypothetical protein